MTSRIIFDLPDHALEACETLAEKFSSSEAELLCKEISRAHKIGADSLSLKKVWRDKHRVNPEVNSMDLK